MIEIATQLGLNWTILFHIGFFSVIFVILSRVYFRPFLKLFREREKRTQEDAEEAERILEEVKQLRTQYEDRLHQAKETARTEYVQILSEAKAKEAEWLGKAREEAKEATQNAVEDLRKTKEKLRQELEGDVERLVKETSDKVLE